MLQALHNEAEGVFGLRAKERAQTTAKDDDELSWLKQNAPGAMGQGVTREH